MHLVWAWCRLAKNFCVMVDFNLQDLKASIGPRMSSIILFMPGQIICCFTEMMMSQLRVL